MTEIQRYWEAVQTESASTALTATKVARWNRKQ